MTKNTTRFDLSDWLIHFFRNIDLLSSSSVDVPDHMGFGNICEDTKLSALFMLRCAIRHGRLWATWSYRNNVRTIYGHSPAVCFTEMPIAAFLESGEVREKRGEAMSQFALVFPKKEMFRLGANPVIYGLDDRSTWPPSGKDGKSRIIDAHLLPEREQYRYVTYNPSSTKPIDWSHEREWRWPFRSDFSDMEEQLEEYGLVSDVADIPGFNFYDNDIIGMGVVVKTAVQATWVVHDILVLVDRKAIDKRLYSFVLASDSLPPPPDLRNPVDVSIAIADSMIDLEPYFRLDKKELTKHCDRFSQLASIVEKSVPEIEEGELGGCWLWLLDNTSILARSLIDCDRIVISESGKYLVNPYEFSDSRGLRQREQMVKVLASKLTAEFGVECGYFSVLNSDNPNAVPFYNDDHIDNHMHYNVSWE